MCVRHAGPHLNSVRDTFPCFHHATFSCWGLTNQGSRGGPALLLLGITEAIMGSLNPQMAEGKGAEELIALLPSRVSHRPNGVLAELRATPPHPAAFWLWDHLLSGLSRWMMRFPLLLKERKLLWSLDSAVSSSWARTSSRGLRTGQLWLFLCSHTNIKWQRRLFKVNCCCCT